MRLVAFPTKMMLCNETQSNLGSDNRLMCSLSPLVSVLVVSHGVYICKLHLKAWRCRPQGKTVLSLKYVS